MGDNGKILGIKNYGFPADVEWKEILATLAKEGHAAMPRGKKILEIVGYRSEVNMQYPILLNPGRGLGYKFLCAEAFWILTGDDRVATIAPYSKAVSQYSDDGVVFAGAYGPKVREQLPYVLDILEKDPYTRQAVMTIWRESPKPSKDIPCTVSVQWIVRDGVLFCIDTMRSSDTWMGWPYDVFNFSMLSAYIYLHLKHNCGFKMYNLGSLILTAGSQHLYEENLIMAEFCFNSPIRKPTWFDVNRFTSPSDLLIWLDKMRNSGGIHKLMEVP